MVILRIAALPSLVAAGETVWVNTVVGALRTPLAAIDTPVTLNRVAGIGRWGLSAKLMGIVGPTAAGTKVAGPGPGELIVPMFKPAPGMAGFGSAPFPTGVKLFSVTVDEK